MVNRMPQFFPPPTCRALCHALSVPYAPLWEPCWEDIMATFPRWRYQGSERSCDLARPCSSRETKPGFEPMLHSSQHEFARQVLLAEICPVIIPVCKWGN